MGIDGPYGIGRAAGAGRLRAGAGPGRASGFTVTEEAAATAVGGGAAVGLPSLLGMQEAGQDAARDRDARRHGDTLLDALGELQGALLGGADDGVLARLESLVRRAPAAADPRLGAIQREVLLRVAVELARRRSATSM